jgi:hypothetical protein
LSIVVFSAAFNVADEFNSKTLYGDMLVRRLEPTIVDYYECNGGKSSGNQGCGSFPGIVNVSLDEEFLQRWKFLGATCRLLGNEPL